MKKSQSAGSIAVLIVLIALFMVLYLIFIPPEDRARLLQYNTTSDSDGNGDGNVKSSNVLLSQVPGLVKPFDKDESKHEIDAVQLYFKNEPIVEDLATSINVNRNLFNSETKELRFNLQDLNNLNKATLFFFVNEAKGELIIELNNVEIFNSKTRSLENIILPKGLLKETNILTFESSKPSLLGKNLYSLSDIKIRENFELTNTKEERRVVLSSSEVGKGELNFFIFCNQAPIGSRLRVFINQKESFNDVVSCVSTEKNIEISEDDLKEGENKILFEIDKGDFLLNGIELKVNLEEGGYRTYKFALTEKQVDDILASAKEIKLTMNFKDDKEKRATININGNELSLDTKELDYNVFITSYIKEGNNFIRMSPSNEFTVDLLEIKVI